MNPIGLTRAEEEKEHPSAFSAQPPAPAGTTRCVATLQPDGKVCGAAAVYLIVWNPEDRKTPACAECAQRFQEQARSFGSSVGVAPISQPEKK